MANIPQEELEGIIYELGGVGAKFTESDYWFMTASAYDPSFDEFKKHVKLEHIEGKEEREMTLQEVLDELNEFLEGCGRSWSDDDIPEYVEQRGDKLIRVEPYDYYVILPQ